MLRMLFGVLAALAAALALTASPAMAGIGVQSSSTVVTGTALGLLEITALPAAFTTGFEPGSTATTSGIIEVTDTESSWSMTVADESGTGQMAAELGLCTGSEQLLQNKLQVEVPSDEGGQTSAGPVDISKDAQTVISSDKLVAAGILTANYSQAIEADEALATGCVYTMTATYTLQ